MAKAGERRILRKVVRVGFAHYRIVLMFIAVGAVASLIPAMFQQRTYRGAVELAMAKETGRSPARLPDLLKLRRLAVSPQHVAVLAGAKSSDDAKSSVAAIIKSINLALVNHDDQSRSFVRLEMDVPASNAAEAARRIQNYVDAMQEDFQANSDPALAGVIPASPATKWDYEIKPVRLLNPNATPGEPGKYLADVAPVRKSGANSAAALRRRTPAATPIDSNLMQAGYQTKESTGPSLKQNGNSKKADPVRQTPADLELRDYNQALAQLDSEEVKLAETAKGLKTSLAGLNVALEEARRGWDERARQMEKLEGSITARMQLLNEIETRGTSSPPAEIEARFPTVAELRKQLDTLQKNLIELGKVVKPSHPDWKAATKEVDDTREKLSSEVAGIIRNERRTIQRLEESQRALERTREKDKSNIENLVSVIAQRDELGRKKQNLRDRIARLQLDIMTARTTEYPRVQQQSPPDMTSTQPPVKQPSSNGRTEMANGNSNLNPPQRPFVDPSSPAGKLLVAGPFVEDDPIRPRITYNVMMGCLVGLVLGGIVVFIRGGSDQRIYSPQDFDDSEVNIKVLGSIPEIKNSVPIRWTGKVNGTSAH